MRGRLLAELVLDIPASVQTASTLFHDSGRDLNIVTVRRSPLTKPKGQNSVALETMGRLVSGVAHDFNNLLTGILLYCDLLITALEDRPRLQSQVKEMRGAGEQGGALIQQLLTLARHQVAEPRPILWNDTIVGLKSFLQRLIGENIELNAELDAQLEPVEMDPAQMQQTILNLVLNARMPCRRAARSILQLRIAKIMAQLGRRRLSSASAIPAAAWMTKRALTFSNHFSAPRGQGEETDWGSLLYTILWPGMAGRFRLKALQDTERVWLCGCHGCTEFINRKGRRGNSS